MAVVFEANDRFNRFRGKHSRESGGSGNFYNKPEKNRLKFVPRIGK